MAPRNYKLSQLLGLIVDRGTESWVLVVRGATAIVISCDNILLFALVVAMPPISPEYASATTL